MQGKWTKWLWLFLSPAVAVAISAQAQMQVQPYRIREFGRRLQWDRQEFNRPRQGTDRQRPLGRGIEEGGLPVELEDMEDQEQLLGVGPLPFELPRFVPAPHAWWQHDHRQGHDRQGLTPQYGPGLEGFRLGPSPYRWWEDGRQLSGQGLDGRGFATIPREGGERPLRAGRAGGGWSR